MDGLTVKKITDSEYVMLQPNDSDYILIKGEGGYGAEEVIQFLLEENKQIREACKNLVANAVVGGDVRMGGVTDCYHIPIDDVEAIKAVSDE